MDFIDLHLENPALLEEGKKLGFGTIFTPKTIFLKTGKDVNSLVEGSIVEGNDSELLRAAAKKKVLINPFVLKGFFKDVGLIRAVSEGKAIFEIPLDIFLCSSGARRSKAIREASIFLGKCIKLKAPYCLTTRAKTHFDLKTPFEMAAIATALGLTSDQAKAAASIYPEKWLK